MRFIQGQPEFKSSLFKRKSVVWFWSLFPQIHFFKFCPCNPAVSFLNSLFFKVTRDKNNEKESRQSFIFHFVSREKIPLLRSSKWNTWRRTVSGHKKGPYGCHRSRVRGPLCRQIGSDGTFDGVMETKDQMHTFTDSREFCCATFDGVCCCTRLPLSFVLPQVLTIQSEADKERAEAKRKIAKLEDALRYNEKGPNQKCYLLLRYYIRVSQWKFFLSVLHLSQRNVLFRTDYRVSVQKCCN